MAGRPRTTSRQADPRPRRGRAAGTSTSSIRWPRNVALARTSTSRKPTPTGAGSPRASRAGGAGRANGRRPPGPRRPTARAARRASARRRPSRPAGRRPTTWSQWSIASSSGSRCAAVQGSGASVTRTSGADGPAEPRSTAAGQPALAPASTTTALDRPAPRREQVGRATAPTASARLGVARRRATIDADRRAGQRVAAEVGVERVEVLVVGRGHPASDAGLRPSSSAIGRQTGCGASQRSTASR